MTKLRWFDMKTNMPMPVLAERLARRKYDRNIGDGFQVLSIRPNVVSGEYIQRLHYSEEVIDPSGERETLQRVEYRRSTFHVSDNPSWLEFQDTGRQQNRLVSQLLEATDFDLTIVPIIVDPLYWAETFQKAVSEQCQIDSIHAKGVLIADKLIARIQVEGPGDVKGAIREFGGRVDIAPEKVRLRLVGSRGSMSFSATAGLEATGPNSLSLVPIARSTLADIAR